MVSFQSNMSFRLVVLCVSCLHLTWSFAVIGKSGVRSSSVKIPAANHHLRLPNSPTALSILSNPREGTKDTTASTTPTTPVTTTTPLVPSNSTAVDAYQISSIQNNINEDSAIDTRMLLLGAGALFAAGGAAALHSAGLSPADAVDGLQRLMSNPQDTLQGVIEYVQDLGPMGPVYFGLIYLVAEILAVPATPLTLSAGYLFGLTQGTAVVLVAATIAASVGFVVGKTFLRTWVEGLLEEKPELAKVDKAIGQEGFKLLLLVRLSPIFPFALSNYVYGASSIDFPSYFWGTLLGFAPGTVAYVYTGMVGQALTLGEGAQPWYVYAGGFALLLGFLKLVTDVASEIVNAIGEEEDGAVQA